MSKKVVERLKAELKTKILETSDFRGDDAVVVAPADWRAVAELLRNDAECAMDHFVDLTAVDYPERADLPRFDVILMVRSMAKKHRIRVKTRIAEDESLASLITVWEGANWAEREVFDMFGIAFTGHPDLRRILMYDEFVGHPLRKDYPIAQTQPLVAYRDVPGTGKQAPFGADEGQPWSRIDWNERLHGRDLQVSPAIGVQQHQRPSLSEGPEYARSTPGGPKRVPSED
jgi:NADH-quinone oxidoreductase subunit C